MNHFHKNTLAAAVLTAYTTSAFAGVVPMFNPSSLQYNNNFSFKANLLLTNDPFTLQDLLLGGMHGENSAKSGDNIALGIARADVGYGSNYGYIGYTAREEVFIKTNKDSVDLIYQATNKEDLPVGRYYDLYLKIKAYQMQGIVYANKFAFHFDKIDGNIGFGVEGLYATQMQDGYIEGYAVADSKTEYSYDAYSNYNYTHNYLYDLDVNPGYAYGYSTHLSIVLNYEKFHFLFLGNDILAKLYWKNLPYSDIYLTSATKVYDESGYAKYNPHLYGHEGYYNYVQTLMAKYRSELIYDYSSSLKWKIGGDYMESVFLPYASLKHSFSGNNSVEVGYETRFQSFFIESHYENFTLGVRADNIVKPSILNLSIALNF